MDLAYWFLYVCVTTIGGVQCHTTDTKGAIQCVQRRDAANTWGQLNGVKVRAGCVTSKDTA